MCVVAEIALDVGGAGDVAVARHAVATLIADLDEDLLDNVRLAVSEVVSNALLHGRPPVSLLARLTVGALRIEVADGHTARGSPQLPSASATSGRGLAIVDTVVDRWGFESRAGGKAMWMEFDLAPAHEDVHRGSPVHLLGVPIDVYLRGQEHLESMLHELRVIATSDPDGFATIEEATAMPLRAAMDTFRGARETGRAEALAAASAGQTVIDFVWTLSPEAATAAEVWGAGVAELDRLAQEGTLLTPAADPEVAALRRWLATEIAGQLRTGTSPLPFRRTVPGPGGTTP